MTTLYGTIHTQSVLGLKAWYICSLFPSPHNKRLWTDSKKEVIGWMARANMLFQIFYNSTLWNRRTTFQPRQLQLTFLFLALALYFHIIIDDTVRHLQATLLPFFIVSWYFSAPSSFIPRVKAVPRVEKPFVPMLLPFSRPFALDCRCN